MEMGLVSSYFVKLKEKKKKKQIGSLITLKPYVQHMSAVTGSFRKNNYKTSASDFKRVFKGPKFWSLNFCPVGKSHGDFFFIGLLLWILLLEKSSQKSLLSKKKKGGASQSWFPPWDPAAPSTLSLRFSTNHRSVLKTGPALEKWLCSRREPRGSGFLSSPGFNIACTLSGFATANGLSTSSQDHKCIAG